MTPAHNPDFAAISSYSAYDAADAAMGHLEHCRECGEGPICDTGKRLMEEYRTKKAKAIKAIRRIGK